MTDLNESAAEGLAPEPGDLALPRYLSELCAATVLLALTGYYVYEAWLLPAPLNPVDIGAGGFPMILGSATLAAVLIFWVRSAISLASGRHAEPIHIPRPIAVAVTAVALIGQAVVFAYINPFLCVGIFSVLIMLAAGERRPAHVIGTPLAIAVGIWLVFDILLNVHFI